MPTNVDKYFAYEHLPEKLQEASKLCFELQQQLEECHSQQLIIDWQKTGKLLIDN